MTKTAKEMLLKLLIKFCRLTLVLSWRRLILSASLLVTGLAAVSPDAAGGGAGDAVPSGVSGVVLADNDSKILLGSATFIIISL